MSEQFKVTIIEDANTLSAEGSLSSWGVLAACHGLMATLDPNDLVNHSNAQGREMALKTRLAAFEAMAETACDVVTDFENWGLKATPAPIRELARALQTLGYDVCKAKSDDQT